MQFLRLLEKQNALHLEVFSIYFGNSEQENILQTHQIQDTVLEIQYWPVNCTTVTVRYAKILSNISFIPIQVMQAITMDRPDENKLFQNAFKGALSCLKIFLATESTLKRMKNAFYFILKALFVLKIFKFLSWLFHHVAKRLD